jgi:hypothetical protein
MLERGVEISSGKPQIVDNLAPARYHIAASQLGDSCYTLADSVIDLSGEAASGPIEIVIAAAGSIRGRLNGSSAHSSDFAIVLVAVDADEAKQPIQIVFPDAESRFRFESLRPGRYRIAARPVEETSKSRWSAEQMFELDVLGGAPTEVEVPVPPAK